MKRINLLFSCFFLIFLILSSIPPVFNSAVWMKNYWIRQYDATMKKYHTRVYAPVRKPGTPYRYGRTGSMVKFPEENRKTKHLRPLRDFLKTFFPKHKPFENQFVAAFPFRDQFSESNMAFKRMIGMKRPIEYDSDVFLPNHFLNRILWRRLLSPEEIGKYQAVSREVNAEFFHVVRPISISPKKGIDEIYPGLYDRTNQKINGGIKWFRKMNIPYLDLRQSMGQFSRNEEFRKLFFRGDHHWKADGALLAAKRTAEYMNRHCGTQYDLRFFDPDVFYRVRYENIFIGSMAKKVSLAYSDEKEHFDILYPSYKTDFTLESPSKQFKARGNFSILLFQRHNHYDSYHTNNYGVFLNGDRSLVRIINHRIDPKQGKKIFVLKDSFGRSLVPYLALQTREIVMLDPRMIGCERILKLIREEKPDIVFSMFWIQFAPPPSEADPPEKNG